MSWKSRIAIPLLATLAGWRLRNRSGGQRVTILAGHRIMASTKDFLLDTGVITASPTEFDELVRFLKANFHLTTFRELKQCVDAAEKVPDRAMIITLDDGYVDSYTNVFPILRRHGVPATVFLSVNHIETGEPFWWDEVARYHRSKGGANGDVRRTLSRLKTVPNSQRIALLSEMKPSDGETRAIERQTCTWDQIREMSQGGMEFGSHTMSHPVLSQVEDDDSLEYEICRSKAVIEQQLGQQVHVFCYPVGRKYAVNDRVRDKVAQAGYSFAVTYQHGFNDFSDAALDPYLLRRIDLDGQSLPRLKSILAFPRLFEGRSEG